ncbi:MAG TPA: phosphoribosylanthranilate isomerase [Gemmatimonadaceae bacterium]|jgi:phosphoribosylanthranilate isomerase
MSVDVKFCGLTRAEDANHAVALGAAYVGVIFASGPRLLSPERAAIVLADVPETVKRVGVFGEQSADEILSAARIAGLDVIQLHGAHDASRIAELRAGFGGEIWPVVRVANDSLPANFAELVAQGDGVLLDALVPGVLGGTGVTLAWEALAAALAGVRGDTRVVLAGGLRPENVAQAAAAMSPDVVDVSSGVESAPGIKDHQRMRDFRDAVAHVSTPT